MSDTELDRSVLDTKDREELHQIAGAMGVNAATRMKKADLIDAILGAVDGGDASDGGNRPKRVRSRRASEADDPIAELAAEEEAIAAAGGSDDASDQPRPTSRTASSSDGDGDDSSSGDGASDTSQSTATSTKDTKSTSNARDGNGGGRGYGRNK